VAQIELAAEVLEDFDRIFEHLAKHDAEGIPERIAEIVRSLDILRDSPLIGRKVRTGKRELVIGKGAHGYVALYRYVEVIDTVFVLALRAQRELGYGHDA
jgi:plasmid stabilization system protein ParE